MTSRTLKVPDHVIKSQRKAADPNHSAWVAANAGSGKTHVLSRRVMRLLLQGTDPSRILCLTYTKAAAAEMSNRVFRDLGQWVRMNDQKLVDAIKDLENETADQKKLAEARRLFARALETPGGLKIQTIHAFCESVLHRFPLEANIAGRFELADDVLQAELLAEARRDLLILVESGSDERLTADFEAVFDRTGEFGFNQLLDEAIAARTKLKQFLDQTRGDGIESILRSEFGFTKHETEDSIATTAWPIQEFDAGYLTALASHARSVKLKTANNFAEGLLSIYLGSNQINSTLLEQSLAPIFLKADGQPKSTKNLCNEKIVASFPDIEGKFLSAADHVAGVKDRLNLFRSLGPTASALRLAGALIDRFDHLKLARGVLDFDDLIIKTIRLFDRPDAGPWIQYKLDKGIDHILVDEAQDTSPAQWQAISRLAREFFTGESSRSSIKRTIFAVGDEKQSIYSFQGADPDIFQTMFEKFKGEIEGVRQTLEKVDLNYSFRSTMDVLNGVDKVFENADARQGLANKDGDIVHRAIRKGEPGFVQIWESIGKTAAEEPEDWRQAIDHATAAEVKLANAIAGTIKRWVEIPAGSPLGGKPLKAGQVMVLVRKRDRFMHALSRALKNLHVPVAGADRLKLRDHIAIKDLMALGRHLLQPQDDLSLAAVLKSPIFGLTDDDLMKIAIPRGSGQSLRDALATHAEFAAVTLQLETWRSLIAQLPVFEFYARLLSGDDPGKHGLRNRLVARLGNEAADLLDEFLGAALDFERSGGTGHDSFLLHLETSGQFVKRQADSNRDEVRIMTAHAAKGLEARLVFLVDSGGKPFNPKHRNRLLPIDSSMNLWSGKGYLWKQKDHASSVTGIVEEEIKRRAEEEYRRLLYVGMTRAKDGLVVCGYHGAKKNDDAWHALVERGIGSTEDYQTDQQIDLGVITWRTTAAEPAKATGDEEQSDGKADPPIFLFEKVPPAPLLPRPLTPSSVSMVVEEDELDIRITRSPVLTDQEDQSKSLQRGTVIHRLLQSLPEIEASQRRSMAENYLNNALETDAPADRTAIIDQVMAIIDDREFAQVFADSSRAEVAVMGTLAVDGIKRAISGKIDRLAVTGSDVLIVDYKTNRNPPHSVEGVSPNYVAQLALYRELIAPIYPDKTVRAALLFTETPHLLVLPAKVMTDALARLNIS